LPLPERRAYHGCFIYKKRMFVHAGVDLSLMYLDNLWSFDLSMLSEFILDETEY